jgi:hypothetical protein
MGYFINMVHSAKEHVSVSDYIQFAFYDLRKEVQTLRVFLPNEENEFVVRLWNGSKIDMKNGRLG